MIQKFMAQIPRDPAPRGCRAWRLGYAADEWLKVLVPCLDPVNYTICYLVYSSNSSTLSGPTFANLILVF